MHSLDRKISYLDVLTLRHMAGVQWRAQDFIKTSYSLANKLKLTETRFLDLNQNKARYSKKDFTSQKYSLKGLWTPNFITLSLTVSKRHTLRHQFFKVGCLTLSYMSTDRKQTLEN